MLADIRLSSFRQQEGSDTVLPADAVSDGTLRFICLSAPLGQPEVPGLAVLDEPELGLHPFAIVQLNGMLRAASRESQVLLATQSVTLMNQCAVGEEPARRASPAGAQLTVRHLHILCEGQTEEMITGDVLESHFSDDDTYVTWSVLTTERTAGGPAFKGGISTWPKLNDQECCAADAAAGLNGSGPAPSECSRARLLAVVWRRALRSSMTLYAELGGFDVILGICVRWHELCLADPEAAHPFEQDLHPRHDERLAAYLAEAGGGPALYTAGYGTESSMQRRHAGNGDHPDLDEACLRLFDQAVAESSVPDNAGARLCAYFLAVTEAMGDYSNSTDDVPDGLPIALA